MASEVRTTIETLVKKVTEFQWTVNTLCRLEGIDEIYPNIGNGAADETVTAWKPDEFYHQPVTSCISKVLNRAAKPLPYEEIRAALEEGGNTELAKVQTTLSKATHTFRKLPNGLWGMASWYKERPGDRRNRTEPEPDEPTGLFPGATPGPTE